MPSRSATEEDLKNQPAVIIGFSESSWRAAEQAGLVNAGGMWMSPEGLEKMRAWTKKQQEEKK